MAMITSTAVVMRVRLVDHSMASPAFSSQMRVVRLLVVWSCYPITIIIPMMASMMVARRRYLTLKWLKLGHHSRRSLYLIRIRSERRRRG